MNCKHKPTNTDGVYYFLGNITSHILHAIPLHKKLGGTFVVTSDKARRVIEKTYKVPVINIDNKPYKIMKPGKRPKLIHEYIIFDKTLKKTYEFLDDNAKVVLFYELFELEKPEWLKKPVKIFLTHGNMLKNYMSMYPKRLDIIKEYDYMAALGPHMKQRFIDDGINPDKLLDIGVARTDEVVKAKSSILVSKDLIKLIGSDTPSKPIVSYIPTFWGASSIYNTGLEIVRNFPKKYTLIFRPHPQTPKKFLNKYLNMVSMNPNILYLPEGRYNNIDIVDILNASSVVIGDVSSVMLEAILTKKPLIFAYDIDTNRQLNSEYKSISGVVEQSQSIQVDNAVDIDSIISTAIETGVDDKVWEKSISYNFFNPNGDSVDSIIAAINSVIKD